MLRYRLTHPRILAGLASAGHGSRVLLTDGHYPHRTACGPNAERVFLNLAPGLVSVPQVLDVLVDAAVVESATVMQPPPEEPSPAIFEEFRRLLPPGTPMERRDRFAFYEDARSPDVALLVATGELRTYANLMLTLGVAA